jgi:hypothetical protein
MFSNPATSILGLFSIVGVVLKAIRPQWGAVIDEVTKALLGGGLIAAADATKQPINKIGLGLRSLLWVAGFGLLLSVLLTATANAQTVTVDLNKAVLAWDWTKGAPPNDGDVRRFDIKCGRQAGVYSATTPINDPLSRSVKISQILNGTGQWFCAVVAVNNYSPSGLSNEVSFDAGAAPAVPSNARVQAQ